jgi:hypothetical protein
MAGATEAAFIKFIFSPPYKQIKPKVRGRKPEVRKEALNTIMAANIENHLTSDV